MPLQRAACSYAFRILSTPDGTLTPVLLYHSITSEPNHGLAYMSAASIRLDSGAFPPKHLHFGVSGAAVLRGKKPKSINCCLLCPMSGTKNPKGGSRYVASVSLDSRASAVPCSHFPLCFPQHRTFASAPPPHATSARAFPRASSVLTIRIPGLSLFQKTNSLASLSSCSSVAWYRE